MSLEDAIKENTAALKALTAAYGARGATQEPDPDAEPAPAGKAAGKANGEAKIDYAKEIKPLALALAKSNRTKLLEIYKHFGVNVGTELKPAQYAEAKKMLEEASEVA